MTTGCTDACIRPREDGPQSHCSVCHLTFGGVSGFDKHRQPDGSCRHPSELGMAPDYRGVWRRQDATAFRVDGAFPPPPTSTDERTDQDA